MIHPGRATLPLAFILAVISTPGQATSLGQLLTWCAQPEGTSDYHLCSEYLETTLAFLRKDDPVENGGHRTCVPAQSPLKPVIGVLASWVDAHPDAKNGAIVEGAGVALQPHYPCT